MSLLFLGACSKKAPEANRLYTPEEFNAIMDTTAAAADKNTANAINFSDYSPGIDRVNSKPLVYERLSFAVLQFENEKQARDEALRLNQYYSRNWVFDKVDGEPILEDLVIVKFHAINPKRHTQRKPVNVPAGSHGGGSGGGGEHH